MSPRRTSPTLLIALAIAAALSTAGAGSARACTKGDKPAEAASRGCCSTRVQPGCRCCGVDSPAPSRTAGAIRAAEARPSEASAFLAATETVRIDAPASHGSASCGCRASEPANASARPQASPRVDSHDAGALAAASPFPPLRASSDAGCRAFEPLSGSRPLYLRTSRLRF